MHYLFFPKSFSISLNLIYRFPEVWNKNIPLSAHTKRKSNRYISCLHNNIFFAFFQYLLYNIFKLFSIFFYFMEDCLWTILTL